MIYKTIYDEYEFANWVKNSDSYSNNFTFEGAQALQQYIEQLSDDMGENIDFDPIAWCCEYSEYENYDDFQQSNGYTLADGIEHKGYDNINSLDELKDTTQVIEFDGGIIIQDF